jgi:hypothetical protein
LRMGKGGIFFFFFFFFWHRYCWKYETS